MTIRFAISRLLPLAAVIAGASHAALCSTRNHGLPRDTTPPPPLTRTGAMVPVSFGLETDVAFVDVGGLATLVADASGGSHGLAATGVAVVLGTLANVRFGRSECVELRGGIALQPASYYAVDIVYRHLVTASAVWPSGLYVEGGFAYRALDYEITDDPRNGFLYMGGGTLFQFKASGSSSGATLGAGVSIAFNPLTQLLVGGNYVAMPAQTYTSSLGHAVTITLGGFSLSCRLQSIVF